MNWAAVLTLSLWASGVFAAPPTPPAPGNIPAYRDLLPTVVEQLSYAAMATAGERHAPRYAAIAFGEDEYVYSLMDKKFIRMIPGRYDFPPWKVCGDWVSVRVALMGESMEASSPESIWFLVFQDGHWV